LARQDPEHPIEISDRAMNQMMNTGINQRIVETVRGGIWPVTARPTIWFPDQHNEAKASTE
jgi:hypothetical protein